MVEKALAAEKVRFNDGIYTPLVTLCTFLSQVLDPDHSCRGAVARVVVWLAIRGRRPCSSETGSDCDARRRLPVGVVRRLVRQTAEEIDREAADGWLWRGRRGMLVDGTTVSMPDTAKNQDVFPQSTTQGIGLGFPPARIVVIIAWATGVVHDMAIGPYQGKETRETALFRTLWDSLKPGDIMLGDRFFCTFFGIAGLRQRSVDVLFRMHRRRKYDFRRGHCLGVEDHVATWTKPARPEWMDETTYDRMAETIEVRELRVKVGQAGFRVESLVLTTTLLDATIYPKEAVADLYLKRRHIEVDLRSIKYVLQMDVLRCKSPEMAEKEIWVHLLAYNLIRGVTAQAAKAHGKPPRELSFKGALQTMAAFEDPLREADPIERKRLMEAMLKAIASHRVGNRFGRTEPRADNRRPKPQKYLTTPRAEARKQLLKQA